MFELLCVRLALAALLHLGLQVPHLRFQAGAEGVRLQKIGLELLRLLSRLFVSVCVLPQLFAQALNLLPQLLPLRICLPAVSCCCLGLCMQATVLAL
jgi:hypothetical protein